MAYILTNCYVISTAFTGLFIPITVPSLILKNIDDDNHSSQYLSIIIYIQLYITVISFACLIAVQITAFTIHSLDTKRSVCRLMFEKKSSFVIVDVVSFYVTILLLLAVTEEQQWKIVGPFLVCRCFQILLTVMIANLVNYDISATYFVYHFHIVCFISSIFIPILVKQEIETFGASKSFGFTILWSLLSLYKNTSKAVLLSAIWLIFWNDEALTEVALLHHRSRLRTFVVESIYIPASIFWITFVVGLLCFRLPEIWQILTMLQLMHSCGLWFVREIVEFKMKRLDPMSPVFNELQVQDEAVVVEIDAALGDLERELNELVAQFETFRQRQDADGRRENDQPRNAMSIFDDNADFIVNQPQRQIEISDDNVEPVMASSQISTRHPRNGNRPLLQQTAEIQEEEQLNREFELAEAEFLAWVDRKYPNIRREWREVQESRRKIKEREEEQKENQDKFLARMNSQDMERNDPTDEDFEDAQEVPED